MKDTTTSAILQRVINRLKEVIDPETNVDVVRMRLVEDLVVDENGQASYTFRPSSPLCPVAVFLVTQIKKAVAEVPGISAQKIKVDGYIAAEELTQIINKEI